jgi:hypothetical protein
MSNYVVPGADPNSSPSGVLSVESIFGAVNFDGVGIAITPAGSDITLKSAVKTLVAGTNCTIVQTPTGTFTISFS